MDSRIGFKPIMFVYSLEAVTSPEELMVTIPDVFVDWKPFSGESTKKLKGNMGIFKNTTLPAFSNSYIVKNYLRLKVVKPFAGFTDVVGPAMIPDGNKLIISSSVPTNYPIDVGIGKVNIGDKLIAMFPTGDPKNAVIIGRCP